MFTRYAIFFTPVGPLADFGASWLGWDSATGQAVSHPDLPTLDIAQVTGTPRKYGFHGTLKAPFRLIDNATRADLQQAMSSFAAARPAVALDRLALRHDNGFVALRPAGAATCLSDLAKDIVQAFDPFRSPLNASEIARRRKANLSERQDRQMLEWGYPFIFDDFHFHLTLTGALPDDDAGHVIDSLHPVVTPLLPAPFNVDAITLMGQDDSGMFHQIHRYALTG